MSHKILDEPVKFAFKVGDKVKTKIESVAVTAGDTPGKVERTSTGIKVKTGVVTGGRRRQKAKVDNLGRSKKEFVYDYSVKIDGGSTVVYGIEEDQLELLNK